METIEQKLDRLAEFQAQKDSIEAQKRAMLDEVKIPAFILALQAEAKSDVEKSFEVQQQFIRGLNAQCDADLAKIVIPDEIKEILEGIDRQRAQINEYRHKKELEFQRMAMAHREEIDKDLREKTAQVFDDVEQRRREIEIEFAGKNSAVDANIAALKAEIMEDTKRAGKTVNGKYFQAVYVRGRVSWNTEGLDKYADDHPEVSYFRKVGEPSISIRARK